MQMTDIRGQLPRNGTWMRRNPSVINYIAVHWDAMFRPHIYDSVARYVSEANYHITKDWGGGAHGDGLMYARKIDNVGETFLTRDTEDVLWAVGDMNLATYSICLDGTTGQEPTKEQAIALIANLEDLSYNHPEFPATQEDVFGHQQIPGNSTACPGTFLPIVNSYRNTRGANVDGYAWDFPPETPAPTPTPTPTPDPSPVDNRPASITRVNDIPEKKIYMKVNTPLVDLGSLTPGVVFPKGSSIDNVVREAFIGETKYYISQYSASRNIWKGIKASDTQDTPLVDPIPTPTPTPTPDPTQQYALQSDFILLTDIVQRHEDLLEDLKIAFNKER